MTFGVYIAGPGIVGWMLMQRDGSGEPMVFASEDEANVGANALKLLRPYHAVRARPYAEGDESVGQYASHPDGYT
jgi:hypothetical protein